MVATIVPVVPPLQFIDLRQGQVIGQYFQTPGTQRGEQVENRPKSVTVGDRQMPEPYNMIELTRDGIVVMARNLTYGRDGQGAIFASISPQMQIKPSQFYAVCMETYQPQFISAVWRYLIGLKTLNVAGPWIVSLSLLKARNCILTAYPYPIIRGDHGPYEGDDMRADAVVIPVDIDLSNVEAVTDAIWPALNEIWRHSGYAETPPILRPTT